MLFLDEIIVCYITARIHFKVSYKDTYKTRAPLAINRAPLVSVYFYTSCEACNRSAGKSEEIWAQSEDLIFFF